MAHSGYFDCDAIAKQVEAGKHRELVGGLWDEMGTLQLDFLRARGLRPESTLLDIGCGSLRLGVRAVDFLREGNYWGTDLNESLLDAGYSREIVQNGLASKLSREHLVVDSEFGFAGVPREFEFAIAQSVFTHLPLNHLRLCLINLAAHVESACKLFLTVFVAPDEALAQPCRQQPGEVMTYPHKDPYHCAVSDLNYLASRTPWRMEFVGDWRHPRNQKMVTFEK
jgi:cyclopropane fatty-acyl-phospholipid synthase-like methyltransferase